MDMSVSHASLLQPHQRQLDQEREEPSALEFGDGPADLQAVEVAGLLAVQVQAVLDHGDVAAVLEVEGECGVGVPQGGLRDEAGVLVQADDRLAEFTDFTQKVGRRTRSWDTGLSAWQASAAWYNTARL